MNSENMMFNQENTSTFDFSKNWDDEFINVDDDDIIIGAPKNEESDFVFDSSFEDSSVFNILNDTEDEIKSDEIKLDTSGDVSFDSSTELDSFFDSIYYFLS